MTATCSSCHAPMTWAYTATGRAIPLDPEPVPDGNIVLRHSTALGRPIAHVLSMGETPYPDESRYVSHFASCPNADQHRRRRS